MTKGVDERIDDCVFRWFSHVEIMEDRIAERVYAVECAGTRSIDRSMKR